MSTPISPALFVAEIVLAIALGLLLLAVLAGVDPAAEGRRRLAGVRSNWRAMIPIIGQLESRARSMGWRWGQLLGAQALAALAGLVVGWIIGIPVLTVGGALAGYYLATWWLGGQARRHHLQVERDLVDMVRNLIELVVSGKQTMEQALVDVATNCPPSLTYILAPLRDTDASIRQRIIEVSERVDSPVANHTCARLLVAIECDISKFLEIAQAFVLPQLEREIEIQEESYAALGRVQTQCIFIMGVIGALFIFLIRQPTYRAAYSTIGGQVFLVFFGALELAVLWAVQKFAPTSRWIRWNLPQLRRQLEGRHG